MKREESAPVVTHLKDYRPPIYTISHVYLTFELGESSTNVRSRLEVKRLHDGAANLVLDGKKLTFKSAVMDGVQLGEGDYALTDDTLTIFNPPESFTLEIENEIDPASNTDLEGLYRSGNIFCTQNEPEGFRCITYYIDRPDVMARFTTKIIGDKTAYPVMLAGGNLEESGDLEGGKHYCVWSDPFPKPSYLYALVAGDLGRVDGSYTTTSGREVAIHIYCDKGNESRCGHALESLKKAMKWDEDTFGLEYDLDIYMIVAVDSFNMGAMENKGLNIFNSSFVLANPQTATDQDFLGIESVVAHEYFHNWTGNRVTCRDWFQLTLKEGLTVYRDQEFSCDVNSRAAGRIGDVSTLRSHQFAEDAGPMAHPIRPESYIEINNFYTATVYNKGAEVIRMLQVLLGRDGFRRGIDKYFELYDGGAVTTDDFLHAMSVANNYDLEQFRRWYFQAGTPEVKVTESYDDKTKTFTLELEQSCPPTAGQGEKLPFVIPLEIGLLGADGSDIPLGVDSVLCLSDKRQKFTFNNIAERPVASINRGFTAPIKLRTSVSDDDLIFTLSHDSDHFNRYEASQTLALRLVDKILKKRHKGENSIIPTEYIRAWGSVLEDTGMDSAIAHLCLSIPGEAIMCQDRDPVDFIAIHRIRRFILQTLATHHKSTLLDTYNRLNSVNDYSLDPKDIGRRSLKNGILHFLSVLEERETNELCFKQFVDSANMTDEISALRFLCDIDTEERIVALDKFYNKWKGEALVMQKWLAVQAGSQLPDTLDRVIALEGSSIYDKKVPNMFRALVGSLAKNYIQFHHESGRGYAYVSDRIVEIDKINPHMSSNVAAYFRDYKRVVPELRERMSVHLHKILEKNPSKHLYEIVSKTLA